MSILYDPSKVLKKLASATKISDALKTNVSLKKNALVTASGFGDFLDKAAIEDVAMKTVRGYKERIAEDPDLKTDIVDDPKQLIQRVQNEVVYQVAQKIKTNYGGEFYVWQPSSADEPSPEHQLNYGLTFQVGVGDANGEDPGDRYGCQCGMEILVDDTTLDLE